MHIKMIQCYKLLLKCHQFVLRVTKMLKAHNLMSNKSMDSIFQNDIFPTNFTTGLMVLIKFWSIYYL